MPHQSIPSVDICHLLGHGNSLQELVVVRLEDFMRDHGPGLVFPHRHEFYQIVYFTEDSGSHTLDFQHHSASKGQIYFMAKGQVHTWDFHDHARGYILNFSDSFFSAVFLRPSYLAQFPLFGRLGREQVFSLPETLQFEFGQLFEKLLTEYNGIGSFRLDLIRAYTVQLLSESSRYLFPDSGESPLNHARAVVQQFELLIDAHYTTRRLPRDYAELLYISPNHLNALTQQVLGRSAGDLIRDRVVLEAKRMLINSDRYVSEIASMLRFEDNSYFVRFFKKHAGVTPEEFRKSRK